jgi:hypothetical protein
VPVLLLTLTKVTSSDCQERSLDQLIAQDDTCVLNLWLQPTESLLPEFAIHHIGVGGIVIKSRLEILCVTSDVPRVKACPGRFPEACPIWESILMKLLCVKSWRRREFKPNSETCCAFDTLMVWPMDETKSYKHNPSFKVMNRGYGRTQAGVKNSPPLITCQQRPSSNSILLLRLLPIDLVLQVSAQGGSIVQYHSVVYS